MPSPENVFFVDWISSDGQGTGKFKLPVSIEDQSLLNLISNKDISNLSLSEKPTIVYKLGFLILQLLLPQNYHAGVEELLDKIETIYPNHHDLSCVLRKMMVTKGSESMNLEHFENLEITSIGLKIIKDPPSIPRDNQDIMQLLGDGKNQNIVANVVALMRDDIMELTVKSNETYVTWQNTLDSLLILERQGGYGYFEEVECNREKFQEISKVLEMIENKYLTYGIFWLEKIFQVYRAFSNPKFREKLTSTIKSVWVQTILSDIELLGYGAFGIVFQTRDETFKELKCATKLIVPSNGDETQNVMREVENLRDLIHPNVLGIKKHAKEISLTEADFKVSKFRKLIRIFMYKQNLATFYLNFCVIRRNYMTTILNPLQYKRVDEFEHICMSCY